MSYVQFLKAERIKKYLFLASIAVVTLLTAIATMQGYAISILLSQRPSAPKSPSDVNIGLFAATQSAVKSIGRCFETTLSFKQGSYDRCDGDVEATATSCKFTWVPKEPLQESFEMATKPRPGLEIEYILAFAGHDRVPVSPNASYDSNFDLAMRRANYVAEQVASALRPSDDIVHGIPVIPIPMSVPSLVCPLHSTQIKGESATDEAVQIRLTTAQQREEDARRRMPMLFVALREERIAR